VNWSLQKKLYTAFGSIIVLVAVLGAIVYSRLTQSDRLAESQSRYQHVALHAQGLYTTLIQLRRYEKDFLREGEAKYETQHQERRRELQQRVEQLRGELTVDDSELNQKLEQFLDSYQRYEEAFTSAIAASKRRGTYDSGLQLEFRNIARELEHVAEGTPALVTTVLQMRSAEKDFLLRKADEDVNVLHGLIDTARKLVARDTQSARVDALLDQYRSKFDAARQAMADIERLRHELNETTDQSEERLAAFVEAALKDARAAETSMDVVHRQTEATLLIAFFCTLGIALAVARAIAGQVAGSVSELMTSTRGIGGGDLRVRVAIRARDELGELGSSFNQMVGSLRDMTSNITTATTSMEDVVRELQATVAEQSAALQQQASSVSETVATVGELSRSADQVSDVARRVLEEADRSVQNSKRGLDAIQQSVQGMNDVREQVQNIATTILDLSERTQQIGSIIATVDDFAERSSLLALNASIEAARAGEAGKAFSVVAGEVKNLAEQSQQATEKVRAILSDIQRTTHTAVMVTEEGSKRVDRGVELATGAGDIIGALANAIVSSADSAKQIAAAARQQNNGIEQISVAMAGIEQFSKQNVEATRQTETTAQTLAAVSKQLRSTTAQYQM
jgi:methyl-accepting chemotaxis protein